MDLLLHRQLTIPVLPLKDLTKQLKSSKMTGDNDSLGSCSRSISLGSLDANGVQEPPSAAINQQVVVV